MALFLMSLLHSHDASTQTVRNDLSSLRHLSVDTIAKKSPQKFKMKKDPWKAVMFSALLPGAGQYYNKSYWKIPVILGLGTYFVYGIVDNNGNYNDYKSLYENSQTTSNPEGNLQYKTFRDFYRDQRDDFIIYSALLYLVNLVDAYVDAQLFDFDVSDLRRKPVPMLKVKLNF